VKGDRLRSFHMLSRLGTRHEIDLATFARPEDARHLDSLRTCVRRIDLVPFSTVRRAFGMLRFLPGGIPFQVALHRSAAMAAVVRRRLHDERYDAVVCTLLRSAANLPAALPCPAVGDFIDSMVLNMSNRLAREKGLLRPVVGEELRRLRRYEPAAARRFAAVAVVSERDRQTIGVDNVHVVPMGVDTDLFAPATERRAKRKVVFTGNLGYFPNVDAATWLAREIFPAVRRRVPDAELELAGIGAGRAVLALDGLPGVRVVGYVENMADFINTAAVAACPMRGGSGMQIKMMEAMACAVPVVASKYAAEGIPAVEGRDFLRADDAAETAGRICELLESEERSRAIGDAGRAFVERHASWDASAAAFESLVVQAVERSAQ